ncbi:c-type cytochrome biogenesis protein CcmI [Marinospirillum alkaliphilum]|uniref:Cytochrome c-type biogenesis protein CcmH n=1 Tax=Marinospirillum alkaliphilum DSM 21637 TaxID=1122209 RepID=A0A1K1VE88_9GAMM|nr:c-type cytochrome biogenesis protein CcmI [Marinospirillum alkaliphilum]SFX22893.1 cytochrome c-type biogenesis protein CcmH [Marinospirillum alkaliphilum DSM 21637]
MIALWIGMFLLALLTALFLIWPVFRRTRLMENLEGQQHARQLANIELYHQKLAQLELDLQEGRVDEAAYPEMKAEIEDLLLDDAQLQQRKPWHQPGRGVMVSAVAVLVAAVMASSWMLYSRLGAQPGLESYFAQQRLIEEGRQDFAGLLRRLEETVQANPNDTQGWSLLARIYIDLGRLEDGAEAIGELIRIQGASARLLAQQAQVLYFHDGNRISPRVQQLIDQAQALDAGEPATLSLLGMAAYQQEDWDAARRHWEAALLRASSVDAIESLREGIAEVRERLGMKPLQVGGPEFAVTISLSNAASLLADPRATVFVFAHREGGGGAPLAATRLRVADLPTTVLLSDKQAMMPDNNLSSAERVVIQARVAQRGTPEAQEGDWQGTSEVLEVDGQQRIELEINQQL